MSLLSPRAPQQDGSPAGWKVLRLGHPVSLVLKGFLAGTLLMLTFHPLAEEVSAAPGGFSTFSAPTA